jgi:hypothetical protein
LQYNKYILCSGFNLCLQAANSWVLPIMKFRG